MGSRAVSVDMAVSVDTEKKGVPPDVDMEVWQAQAAGIRGFIPIFPII